jgi:hypothetical protein
MNLETKVNRSELAPFGWTANELYQLVMKEKALEKLLWGFGIQYLESESGAQLELCEIPSLVTLWQ